MTEWHAERFPPNDDTPRCRRRVEFIRQAPAGATGFEAIDMAGYRPCGGRLINGRCEMCDETLLAPSDTKGG